MGHTRCVTERREASAGRVRSARGTREELLRAAIRRFVVLGYERSTTRDIAADAGVNVSLISRYFGSKDGLFAEAVRASTERMDELSAGRPSSRIEMLLDTLEPNSWPQFGGEHPLPLLLQDVGDDERVRDLRRRSLRAVIGQLADEIERGPRPVPADARLSAELVLALAAGVLTLQAALPDDGLAVRDTARLRAAVHRVLDCLRD